MRLRAGLVKTISGPVNQIAVQLGVTAAKAARYNVPQGWPELLSVLSEAVQAEDDTLQHRGLLFLHHTIKALASTRLTADRRAFTELSGQIVGHILNLWHALHTSLLQQIGINTQQAGVTLEKAILSLKILKKLIILGLKKPDECPDAMNFVSKLFVEAKTLLEVRKTAPPMLVESLEKYCVLHQKIWYDLLENHPFSFVQHISTCLSFICSLCFTNQGEGLLFQRFTIFNLNLLKRSSP